jgi:hypothetical protein
LNGSFPAGTYPDPGSALGIGQPGASATGNGPAAAAAMAAGSSYEGQLVSHIMEYINNLWRVDPGNFAATLNTICMRAPALMQRLMDHELAANAALEQRFAGGESGNGGSDAASLAHELSPGLTALHHPHELEVRCPS